MKRFSKFIQESVELDEKLKASDDMGDWVKDFQDSDAPQFKGKSQKKRQQMAIAAKLSANEEFDLDESNLNPGQRPSNLGQHPALKKAGVKHKWHQSAFKASKSFAFVHDKDYQKAVNALGKDAAERGGSVSVSGSKDFKESVELDEISKDTLGRYASKALNRGDMANRMSKSDDDGMGKIANKRLSGVKKAVSKLADKTGKKALATSIKKDVDTAKASGNAFARGGGVDDQGKSYYKAMRNIGKMREEIELDEVSDKKLDAYRQKAFADQPAGDDGSDKYRKRKFGRDLAFAKQTGRAKVLATKKDKP